MPKKHGERGELNGPRMPQLSAAMNDDDAATVGEACLPQVIIEGCQASVHGLSTAELERGLGVAMARLRSLRSSLLHVRGPSRRVLDDAGAPLEGVKIPTAPHASPGLPSDAQS